MKSRTASHGIRRSLSQAEFRQRGWSLVDLDRPKLSQSDPGSRGRPNPYALPNTDAQAEERAPLLKDFCERRSVRTLQIHQI